MKLIVGLGNPGEKYKLSRHNAGWLFLDYIATKLTLLDDWQEKSKFGGIVARSESAWLLKPGKFMNQSGVVVQKVLSFYKLKTSDLVVVHDDLDISLGQWKLQQGVGPKVHNGLLSLESALGVNDFWRLRLGIDNRSQAERQAIPGEDYVLAGFRKEELASLEAIFPSAWTQLSEMLG
jgi:PTH1 family peptidyl-tRNA hydrolase